MAKLFILTVGHNGSGKTTLARKLSEKFNVSCIEGDDFRNFLREKIVYFKDLDFSHPNPKAAKASELTQEYRVQTCRKLLEAGQSVIHCSVTPTIKYRTQIIDSCTSGINDIRVVIVYVQVDDSVILERLAERDRQNPDQIGWVKHYTEIKRPLFEPPTPDESDDFIVYDQENYDEIENRIGEMILD